MFAQGMTQQIGIFHDHMAVRSVENERKKSAAYNPARWRRWRRGLRFLLRYPGWILMRVAKPEGLENIPPEGPAIVMINHIGWVDPLVAMHASPRPIVPMGKIEAFKYPVVGILPRLWGAIPVKRNGVDSKAIRLAMEVLEAGEVILVAPEGTRNVQLQPGLEGVAFLATRSGVPIIPAALEDTQGFPTFPLSKRWWGPPAKIKFGRSFRFKSEFRHSKRDDLRRLTDTAMYMLAELLPEGRRGVYSDLSNAEKNLIERL
jgi:1-acyl-sn-glycerol-3-phosphate acyltransferase